MLNVSE